MLSEATFERVRERVRRFPPFDAAHYADLYDDLGGADAISHYAKHGMWQRRDFAPARQIVALIGSLSQEHPAHPDKLPPEAEAGILKGVRNLEIGVYANSIGNFFMREIAELVAAGLRALGARVSLLDENGSIEDRPRCCIFVAPHEFFDLGRGTAWAREDILSSSFMYSTEQMQSPWFRVGLPFLLSAKGVVELNYQSHRVMAEAGIPSLFFFPGFDGDGGAADDFLPDHPLARLVPDAARKPVAPHDLWTDRPLDLVFLATESPIRDRFLAEAAGSFAKLSSFIHYVRLEAKPIVSAGPELRPALNRYVCRRAKIVLNVHQGEANYFEWHRMVMQGMWNKALVVSDPCLPHPVFKPGEHYLEERPDRIPQLIEWLLTTAEGQTTAERVRHEAWATLAEQASARRMSLGLADFLLRHRN